MKKYTKQYFSYFGYALDDFLPCEVCGNRAVDLHHIDCKGMGGSKLKDNVENIMAVCRQCHVNFGDKKEHIEFLKETHLNFLYENGKG
jgi:5-methylcytosine-specific restriction endonuclease McrA